MSVKTDFAGRARIFAACVADGTISQETAERELGLLPGQHLAPNGVIMGHEQDPDIPRFGADEAPE